MDLENIGEQSGKVASVGQVSKVGPHDDEGLTSEGAEVRLRAEVIDWIEEVAHPLTTTRPSAPLEDLRPLAGMLGRASIVGYGAGTRGAHEVFTMQDRIARLLVGAAGFRVVAFDQDWTLATRLDAFARAGTGDPRAILADAEAFADTEEMLGLVEWVRDFNQNHPDDPVRLAGVSPHAVGAAAYDTVLDHFREAAPARLDELAAYYADLRPEGDLATHTDYFRKLANRTEWVERARAAHDLVAEVTAGLVGHTWALHTARVIVQFYELHDHDDRPEDPFNMAYFEQSFAENVEWWQRYTGRKTLFWSSSSHTSNGLYRGFPPTPSDVSRNAGSYLRERLGPAYLSIGLTFHDGELATYARTDPLHVPGSAPELIESVLGGTGLDGYLLDLDADRPQSVAEWLSRTAKFRVIGGDYDPDADSVHHMTGGSPRDWFDVIVHCQHVTPARPVDRAT
ncbi:erythromycin esterase family protein [Amycolatopsis sp. cmx-11-32]|uniref:erythromycin esterase family protein n=1 Tax=Amycolatopsis sp. cmx-11-32 TaxID=2785796 RepID=UPI0039E36F39